MELCQDETAPSAPVACEPPPAQSYVSKYGSWERRVDAVEVAGDAVLCVEGPNIFRA